MANTLLKFKRASGFDASSVTAEDKGLIVFDVDKHIIHVVTDEGTTEKYGAGVKSAEFNKETEVLTIINQDGDRITASFKDIASAKSVAEAITKINTALEGTVKKTDAYDETPSANTATGSAGESEKWARGDHSHPLQESADKWTTPRTITLTGGATGSVEDVDGSKDITINTTVNAENITGKIDASTQLKNEIPIELIPQAALERLVPVTDESAAVSAVSNGTVQEGDVVQLDNGKMYFCISTEGDEFADLFKEFTAGTASSVKWSGITEIPKTVATSSTMTGTGKVITGIDIIENVLTATKGDVVNSLDNKTGDFSIKKETADLKVQISVSDSKEISAEVIGIGSMAGEDKDDYYTVEEAEELEESVEELKSQLGVMYWSDFGE